MHTYMRILNSNKFINYILPIISIILLMNTFLFRPGIYGEKYTKIGLVISIIAAVSYWFLNKKNLYIQKQHKVIMSISCLYAGYLLLQSIVLGSTAMIMVVKQCTIIIVIVLTYGMILSNKTINKYYFKYFIFLMIITSGSYLITSILNIFIDTNKLLMINLETGGSYNKNVSGLIYFPITIIYSLMHSFNYEFLRFQALFREAGIAQAFLIWSFFNLNEYGFNKKIYKLILFIGIMGTFSSAALPLFFITLLVEYFVNNKNDMIKTIKLIILACSAAITIIFMPFVGLKDKMVTHSESINTRLNSTLTNVLSIFEKPLGKGFNINDAPNSGINLLAFSSKIGMLGLILSLCSFFLPSYYSNNRKKYIVNIIPLFLTALLSQPIVFEPILLIFTMWVSTSILEEAREKDDLNE